MFLLHGNICAGCRVVGMYSIKYLWEEGMKWERWREEEGERDDNKEKRGKEAEGRGLCTAGVSW